MKIAISGSTGFIGKQVTDYLLRNGNEILVISRKDFADADNRLAKIINSAEVILNFAGSSVLCRWNKQNRAQILSSRIETTRLLVEAVRKNSSDHTPKVFVNASAIGIYENSGIHDETSSALGSDFLASVCKAWEQETESLKDVNVRTCIVRIGIVLGKTGGTLGKLLPLFKAGLGGKIGTGKQSFSFIHILDFCRIIEHLIDNHDSSGIYNLTSPEPTTNELFTKALAKAMHRPDIFTVPEFSLKLIYGEAAGIITSGIYAKPTHLLNENFQFQFPDITSAIGDLVQNS
ncbi:MAG: TIGR01777 family oxidoreductase [Mariniphaga sp.]